MALRTGPTKYSLDALLAKLTTGTIKLVYSNLAAGTAAGSAPTSTAGAMSTCQISDTCPAGVPGAAYAVPCTVTITGTTYGEGGDTAEVTFTPTGSPTVYAKATTQLQYVFVIETTADSNNGKVVLIDTCTTNLTSGASYVPALFKYTFKQPGVA